MYMNGFGSTRTQLIDVSLSRPTHPVRVLKMGEWLVSVRDPLVELDLSIILRVGSVTLYLGALVSVAGFRIRPFTRRSPFTLRVSPKTSFFRPTVFGSSYTSSRSVSESRFSSRRRWRTPHYRSSTVLESEFPGPISIVKEFCPWAYLPFTVYP